ncbi:MAG: helix-turn-helix transcriptional regulator [Ruminococcaceae bacterium]|nr:helix-turn-helix transcriptional regulator [Oscillospiraceae bacterium]
MINDNLIVEIIDVLKYKEKRNYGFTSGRDFAALSYRLNSDVSFTYNGKTVKATTDTICFFPKDITYSKTGIPDDLIVFHFYVYSDLFEDILFFKPDDTEKYKHLFLEALKIWEEKRQGYKYKATSYFYEILFNMQSDGAFILDNSDKDILKAKDEIERNFKNADYKIADLAFTLHMSEAYLRRKFKKLIGISPKKYLIRRKITQAQIMLKSTYFTQSEIALKCGFSDVKYFRYAFKEQTGLTIREYLKKQS